MVFYMVFCLNCLYDKDEYEQLRQRIDEAAKNFAFRDIAAELADIDNTKPNNHAPIIKVLNFQIYNMNLNMHINVLT